MTQTTPVDAVTVRPLPTEIEQISCDWLTAALRQHAPDITVRGFRIVDMNRGTCTKIRLHLDLVGNRTDAPIPQSVILKGGFEPHSRAMWYMHEKESRAYAELMPALGLRMPACYFVDFDADSAQGIIIMEDLVARGVRFCSPLVPHSYDDVASRLGHLARFHARSWDSPALTPGGQWDWADRLVLNAHQHFGTILKPEIWSHFIDSARGAAASVRFHDLDWMIDAMQRMAAFSEMLPHCVLHGDTHLGNLYVDTDGTPGFFDPQSGRGPAMVEVAYHLTCALDTADRPRFEAALIQHYLDELARAGASPPSFEEAMRQYALFLAFGYLIFIVNDAVFQPEANNTAYTARFSAAMLAHDSQALLAALPMP